MSGIMAMAIMATAATLQAGQVPAAEAEQPEAVQAETDQETRLTVPVHVEGEGPFRFLVDTGSQSTVLSSALAERLELAAGPQVRIVGVADTLPVGTVHVESLDFGRLSLDTLLLPLLEKRNMGADGIIGTDSLQGQRVLLDFENDRIELGSGQTRGGSRGYEIIVRARRRAGQLIITQARIDGISVAIVLDTGGGTSIGNRALQRALGKRGSRTTPVTLKSVTGQSVTADIGFAQQLEIDEVGITNLVIAFTDTPAFEYLDLIRKPALFLGMREMRLFKRVAIDFPRRKVLFDMPGRR